MCRQRVLASLQQSTNFQRIQTFMQITALGSASPPCRFKIPIKTSEQRKRADSMIFRRIRPGGPDPVAAVLGLIA